MKGPSMTEHHTPEGDPERIQCCIQHAWAIGLSGAVACKKCGQTTLYTGDEPMGVAMNEGEMGVVERGQFVHMNADGGICHVHQPHDEALRMQALAIGARLVEKHEHAFTEGELTPLGFDVAKVYAKWAYRDATGREW